jgi:hypothetical protein
MDEGKPNIHVEPLAIVYTLTPHPCLEKVLYLSRLTHPVGKPSMYHRPLSPAQLHFSLTPDPSPL